MDEEIVLCALSCRQSSLASPSGTRLVKCTSRHTPRLPSVSAEHTDCYEFCYEMPGNVKSVRIIACCRWTAFHSVVHDGLG